MTEPSESFGAQLRRARQTSGMTLRQIADATKQSVQNLNALENDRVDQLPGGIYCRAIVRNYAAQVGLDPEQMLRAFLAKYPDDIPTWADLVPPKADPWRNAKPILRWIGAVAPMLAGIFYVALAGGKANLPIRTNTAANSDVLQASLIPALPSSARGDDAVAMLLSFSSATTLQVVADGQEMAARRYAPGDILRVTLGREVILLGDNAGAVHFSINGRAGRTLGSPGTSLTARIFRADYEHWLVAP